MQPTQNNIIFSNKWIKKFKAKGWKDCTEAKQESISQPCYSQWGYRVSPLYNHFLTIQFVFVNLHVNFLQASLPFGKEEISL